MRLPGGLRLRKLRLQDLGVNSLRASWLILGWIDPHLFGQPAWIGLPSLEAVGMLLRRCFQDFTAFLQDLCRRTIMNRFWSQHNDSRVPVFRVVPRKEKPTEISRILNRPKPFRELWVILESFELGL